MGLFKKRVGQGAKLKLVTSDLVLDVKTMRRVGQAREAHDVTSLDAEDRTYLPGRINNPGTIEADCFFDPRIYEAARMTVAQPYVLTFPLAEGEELAAEETGNCFVTDPGDSVFAEGDAVMMTVRIQRDGKQEFKAAKLAGQ